MSKEHGPNNIMTHERLDYNRHFKIPLGSAVEAYNHRLNSRSVLEMKNYRSPYKHVEGDKRTGTTRKNACDRETMMKIRVVIIFIIAQVVLTK